MTTNRENFALATPRCEPLKFLIAIDSFKGSLSSMEAGNAAAVGIKRAMPGAEIVVRPLADGGEGTVSSLVSGLNGELRKVRVTGPMGLPVDCEYGIVDGNTCVMEMAGAAGITLVASSDRNPLVATTYGVGEVIIDAMKSGCRKFIVGIGGSATNDGGAGMLQALGFKFTDADGKELDRGGAALSRLCRIDSSEVVSGLAECEFCVACDVTNPLCGDHGASAVFGPQKGATSEMVQELDAALSHFALVAGDDATTAGDGAAGGLGFAFRRFLNARLERGVELILNATKMADCVANADVVITGEGRLDAQTVMGKAPIGVAHLAKEAGKVVIAFSGCVSKDAGVVNEHGIDAYFPIPDCAMPLEEALDGNNAARNLERTAEQTFRAIGKFIR